ncbi:MAG: hypothetical protein R2827_11395 [Bdellovibrionales bacterium]
MAPLQRFDDRYWIDHQIDRLMSFGHAVTVVLGGESAEEILIKSESLIRAELVFDTNGVNTSLYTNIQAGVFAVENFACTLPIDVPCPDRIIWDRLRHHYVKLGNNSPVEWVQSYSIVSGHAIPTHPSLVTFKGIHSIRNGMFSETGPMTLVQSSFPILNPLQDAPSFYDEMSGKGLTQA